MKLFSITASAGLMLLALTGPLSADTLCVTLHTALETPSYPVATGELLGIAFTHSIYGSQVEERFQINEASFESIDVRYSEARLVEFYGYESATRDGRWWVTRPARRKLQTLALRASQDSIVRISVGKHTVSLADGSARVALGRCSRPTHG